MAKIGKLETTTVYEMEGFEGRYEDLDGTTVGFETYTQDADPAPLLGACPTTAASARTGAWWFAARSSTGWQMEPRT